MVAKDNHELLDKAKERMRIEKLVYVIAGEKEFLTGYCMGYKDALLDDAPCGLSKEDALKRIASTIRNTPGA